MTRQGEIVRETRETRIQVNILLEGKGQADINTGIGFFDHMLELMAFHGRFDLKVKARGDLHVDFHHTVEDTGIALGQALTQALGDKRGIQRYATVFTPMDESLSLVSLDISGRPYLVYTVKYTGEKAGTFDLELVEEFMRALAVHSGITLHIALLYGCNNHHIVESIFKGLGRALGRACEVDHRMAGEVPSTKEVL